MTSVSEQEVTVAVKQLNSKKTAAIASIQPELLLNCRLYQWRNYLTSTRSCTPIPGAPSLLVRTFQRWPSLG